MKVFFALLFILTGLIVVYMRLPVPAREGLAGLFALDYQIPVEVQTARKRSLGRVLTAVGELEPVKETRISATIPGVVKEIRYNVGDNVSAGAVVATVEAAELAERLSSQEAALKEAEANVKRSQDRLAAAEKHLAALHELYRKDFIARREVESAATAVEIARAQRQAADAQLAQRASASAQTRHVLGLTEISAPASGVVTRRWIEPGSSVSGAAPILSIAGSETLKVLVNLKSSDTEGIQAGSMVQVESAALPQGKMRAKVTQIQEAANFTGDESIVEIELANPKRTLKFGAPVKVLITVGETRQGLLVPRAALDIRAGTHLYVVAGGKARRKDVTLGKEYDGGIEVVAGLQAGETVVVRGAERLRDGNRVRAVK